MPRETRVSFRVRSRRRALAPSASAFALSSLLLLALSPALAQESAPAGSLSAGLGTALEQKYDSGAQRALAPAQACYREALAALQAGRSTDAVRLLEAAALFDPLYPDPHFTLARLSLPGSPGRAVAELSQAFRIVGRSYAW